MTEAGSQPEPCPNCTKFGLPILPVRYAVARNDADVAAKAPGLGAPFGDGVEQLALPDGTATYTLRLLRNGYLYVYNESRNQWKAYQVDNHGDLAEFDIRAKSPPPQEDGPQEVCSRHGVPALAKCIVLPDVTELTTLWMAFSPVAWTPARFSEHQKKSFRKRHMRQINAGAWVKKPSSQPHLDNLYQRVDQVAEFKLAADYKPVGTSGEIPTLSTVVVTPGARPFSHSLADPFAMDRAGVDALKSKAREAARQTTPGHPQGVTPALVALNDPTGIAADINQIVLERIMEWEQESERHEKMASASAIVSLREAILNGALEEEQERRRDNALLRRSIIGWLGGRTATRQLTLPVEDWDDDWFRVEDEETVLRLGQESWKKYRNHLKGNEYETWLTETYPAEQKAFYETHLQKLDEALVRWLQAPLMHEHMTCNFDSEDIDSGIQYQETVAIILQDAASRGVVYNHIVRCLDEEDPAQPASIILRAQVWNQDKAVEAWKAAASGHPEGVQIDWANLCAGLFDSLKELMEAHGAGTLTGAFENLAKYIEQLSGPLTKMVGHRAAGLATGVVMKLPHKMQMGLLGALVKVDAPSLEIIDLVGHMSPRNASRALAGTIAMQAGVPDRISAGRPAREVLRAGGAPTSGPGGMKFGYVVLADAEHVRMMNALNIRAISPGNSYQTALQQHYSAHQSRTLMRQSIAHIGNRSLGLGVVGLIFAGGSLGQLGSEYKKAAPGTRGLKAANFSAGVAGLLGACAETVGAAGSRLPWFSQNRSTPNRWFARKATTRAAMISAVGRSLTAVGGVVIGAVMVVEGWRETSLSMGYGITIVGLGIASVLAAAMLFFGFAIPAAVILLIIVAVVSVVVSWFKPDEIQRWLDKVMRFGKNASGVYPDLDTQGNALKALQQAR